MESDCVQVVSVDENVSGVLVHLRLPVAVLVVRVEDFIIFLVLLQELIDNSLLLIQIPRLLPLNIDLIPLVFNLPKDFESDVLVVQDDMAQRIDHDHSILLLDLVVALDVLGPVFQR